MKRVDLVLVFCLLKSSHCLCLAAEAERAYPENSLLAQPKIRITVGHKDTDIIGTDNRALQAAVDYVANLGGGVVDVGPGKYLMRDSLHLRSRVTVRGAGETTVFKKDREYRTPLVCDADFGESAITLVDDNGFDVGRGVYVASNKQRYFHGLVATTVNRDGSYLTLNRSMNADLLVVDSAFAATVFPVVSGYDLQDACIEDVAVDGNKDQNPTQVDGCRTAGIYLYRADNCRISRCYVRDYNGDGISFQQSNEVVVSRCEVVRCAGYGLHPGSGSQRPKVNHCRAFKNGSDGLFFCWRVRGGTAEHNWLEANGGYGLSIGHKDSNNGIRHNTIVGNKRGGVYWRNESAPMAAHNVTFEDNLVRNNHGWGLFVDGETNGTIIRGNIIEDTDSKQTVGIRIGRKVGPITLDDNLITAQQQLIDERSMEVD